MGGLDSKPGISGGEVSGLDFLDTCGRESGYVNGLYLRDECSRVMYIWELEVMLEKPHYMKFAMLLIVIFLLIGQNFNSYGQLKLSSDFIKVNQPKVGTKEYFFFNHSENGEFGVEMINGELEIKKAKYHDTRELKITGGKLVGIDQGEFSGGKLMFVPFDTAQSVTTIKYCNVGFIFMYDNKIHFMEVNGGPGFSDGTLYELDTTNQTFSCKKRIYFDDVPFACSTYNDKLLVVTDKRFYVVRDYNADLIIDNAFWTGMYPSSIAVKDDKNIFLGMRGGVTKLDLTTKNIELYKYSKL